jgi:cAMP-dependent protein kinase regulator
MADSHAADVQAELQQYLNSKNINSLFIQIVESLLIEKPGNPIAFMIEYLNKQYPDQAKEAMGNAAPVEATPAAAPPVATPAPTDPNAEESDEDEDDYVDMPDIAPAPKPKSRRVSVSAESMDPSKLKAQKSQVTNIAKEPEVAAKLLETVSKGAMLRTLDADQKDMIVNAFSGPISKAVGEDVIVQGDIGDTFYLLEEGTVDVYISKGGGEPIKVHTYKPGDAFGDLALMYNAPRAATCRASSDAKLWVLDRVSFKVIVVAAAMEKREQYIGFLKGVPILESVTEMEIMTLADSLAEEKYQDGHVMCQQGDAGDYFYIIKNGTAVCSQVDAEGADKEVAKLTDGMYFGEIALLTSKPRQATVKALGELTVLAIDRATFTRVMGPLDDIMKRNMEDYNKYAAQAI